MKYKIIDILHSGRKGMRNTEVTNPKYDKLKDAVIKLQGMETIEDAKQYNSVTFLFTDPADRYDYWETTAVISLGMTADNEYNLETVNTIYMLEAVNE